VCSEISGAVGVRAQQNINKTPMSPSRVDKKHR